MTASRSELAPATAPVRHEVGKTVEDLLAAAQTAPPAGREEILARVVVDQLPLARRLAARYRDRGEPLEDLVQVASMALVMTVRRYQPGQGRSFTAYATPTINGELRRHFREQGWSIRPPRSVQELRPRLAVATEELTQALQRPPTVPELAEHLQVPVKDVRRTQLACRSYDLTSLDTPVRRDGGGAATVRDVVGQCDGGFERVVERASARALLALVSERERWILARRYLDGCTQQQIADEIGVTQMHVCRLLHRSLQRLHVLAARD